MKCSELELIGLFFERRVGNELLPYFSIEAAASGRKATVTFAEIEWLVNARKQPVE